MEKLKILRRFNQALEAMADRAKVELAAQGHKASGKGINSLSSDITKSDLELLVGVIMAEDYLLIVDEGVKASSVPFAGRGSGGTSQYIQGLMDWADIIKPGLATRERINFVFAVANTQRRTGIPTPGSFRFSSNGRRTNWIEESFETKDAQDEFERIFDLFEIFTDSFNAALDAVDAA